MSIVKDIANLKQMFTQSGGLRPFGVSLLIAGIDEDGAKLFETDPTGIFFQYRAIVIGEGEAEVEEILYKEFKDELTIEECLRIAIKALSKFLDKDFNVDRIDAAYVKIEEPLMKKVEKSKIESIHKEVSKV
jgi:proteasome alpha subunit